MKKILTLTALYATITNGAYAVTASTCTQTTMCTESSKIYNIAQNCNGTTSTCYSSGVGLTSCSACISGYELTTLTTSVSECSGTVSYKSCVAKDSGGDSGGGSSGGGLGGECSGPSTSSSCPSICSSESLYSKISTGYVAKCASIGSGSAKSYYCEYSCAAGYYGTAKNNCSVTSPDMSGCTQCPSYVNALGAVRTGSSTQGSNKTITSCYVGTLETFSDPTGTYSYTSNCYYSE